MSEISIEKLTRGTSSITVHVTLTNLWISEESKYRTKIWSGSNVAYSEEGRVVHNSIISGDPCTVTLGSLSSGTYYVVYIVSQVYDKSAGDWVNESDIKCYRILTNGRTPKWSWTNTNYDYFETVPYTGFQVRYSDDDELVYADATADICQKAYNTLTGVQQPTSGVDTRVWNSIVRRISAIQTEWGVPEGRHLDEIRPTVFCTTRDPGYYYDYDKDKYVWLDGRAIKAYKFNKAVECIPVKIDWPWVNELGRKEIKPGDICKASYFLALVDALNHWIGLTPKYLSITADFIHDFTVGANKFPSSPCEVSESIPMWCSFIPGSAESNGIDFENHFHLTEVFDVFVESSGAYFTSIYNFFEHESQCEVHALPSDAFSEFVDSSIAPFKEELDIDGAESCQTDFQGSIKNPTTDADIADLDRHLLEHEEALHIASSEIIDFVPAVYLEQHGFFGFVNKFTLARNDELNDYTVSGAIHVISSIESVSEAVGITIASTYQFGLSGTHCLLTQPGSNVAHAGGCSFEDTITIRTADLIPLDFEGHVGISADVDNLRQSGTREIPAGGVFHAVSAYGLAAIPKTLDMDSAGAAVNVVPIGSSAGGETIDLDGKENLAVSPAAAGLSGQQNTAVSVSISTSVKPNAEMDIGQQKGVEGEIGNTIRTDSTITIKNATNVAVAVVIQSQEASGEIAMQLPRGVDAVAGARVESESELHALDMAKSKPAESECQAIFSTTGELTAAKNQKGISLDCPSAVDTEAELEFTTPTPIDGADSESVVCDGSVVARGARTIGEGLGSAKVNYSVTMTVSGVTLVLASEIEDTLAETIDNEYAIEVERKLTANTKED